MVLFQCVYQLLFRKRHLAASPNLTGLEYSGRESQVRLHGLFYQILSVCTLLPLLPANFPQKAGINCGEKKYCHQAFSVVVPLNTNVARKLPFILLKY